MILYHLISEKSSNFSSIFFKFFLWIIFRFFRIFLHCTKQQKSSDTSYSSPDIAVSLEKITPGTGEDTATYFLADIYVADIECIQASENAINQTISRKSYDYFQPSVLTVLYTVYKEANRIIIKSVVAQIICHNAFFAKE